ncbi:mRNA 3'-end processing factor [Halobacteriales archaeon SW_7_68_16]|nr:MAG: mRNA 3'-end processing factor [Halobacteriales archaeon SW_7_68_16]
MNVTYGDGVRIDLATGETVVADAGDPDGDVALLSHAHGDHLYHEPPAEVVCSETTAALARVRRDGPHPEVVEHPRIDLLDAGHVAGSRAALIDDGETRLLYTGDISTRDRFFLSGLSVPDVDVLVTEATYGRPGYVFDPQEELEAAIVDWLRTTDAPVLLMGYALGRAQELHLLADRAGRTVHVTDAIRRLDETISDREGVGLDARSFDADRELTDDDAVVLPAQTGGLSFVDRLREAGAIKAGFSGWAVDEGFRFRGDHDETFVLSDHCDFSELIGLVERADPEQVYTVHGFTDDLARELTGRGFEARSLKWTRESMD